MYLTTVRRTGGWSTGTQNAVLLTRSAPPGPPAPSDFRPDIWSRSTAGAAGPGPGSSEALMQAVQQWSQQLRADLPAAQVAEQQLAQEVCWSGSIVVWRRRINAGMQF